MADETRIVKVNLTITGTLEISVPSPTPGPVTSIGLTLDPPQRKEIHVASAG